MNWIWAALMPHPPVLVPDIGQGREQEAATTLRGMEALGDRLAALPKSRPDFLLLLSPHQPSARGALLLNSAPSPEGDLGPFGAPHIRLALTTPAATLTALVRHLGELGIPVASRAASSLTPDHGSLVPLYFLSRSFALPPVILASPIGLSSVQALALGKALASFDSGGRGALLASGDLSHRLKAEGPYGFHPDGVTFDAAVEEALSRGNPAALTALSGSTAANAGECGLRSVLALLGLAGGPVAVLSHEGPFGVGYCTAFWQPDSHAAPAGPHPYPALARAAVRHLLKPGTPPPDILREGDASLWSTPKACFVSIKTLNGGLRGCIGTIAPSRASLAQEIRENAISAAIKDWRFRPMTAEELDGVTFSVDILSTPEPVEDVRKLDPSVYGVIVSKGNRRGLLLPDLPGVTTVDQQLRIAADKGGISNLAEARIERFTVERYPEDGTKNG
ncbi:MAG: AmmeMemoRadiSam system protein A [Desulfovibrio sp.]|jgi:AmmeMemoRadiSam system protein A|nr:AmmeMemoRadiSam system protein A [Desulfovibrio sp.]